MNKILLKFSLATMLVACFAFAQSQDNSMQGQMPSAQDRAAKMTDWMKSGLNLTDAQLPKVTEINTRYAGMTDSLRSTTGDRSSKMQAMKTEMDAKDAELKGILTADQYKTYQAKEAEMKQKYMDKMKSNGTPPAQ